MPYGRPQTRPGWAQEGQYKCLVNRYDQEADEAFICGKDVPEGELTHVALNSRSGQYLALCTKHREALEETMEEWLSASVGFGRLLASLTQLRGGRLVSHTELREILMEHGDAVPKNGPLTDEQQVRAVLLKFGDEDADFVLQRLSHS